MVRSICLHLHRRLLRHRLHRNRLRLLVVARVGRLRRRLRRLVVARGEDRLVVGLLVECVVVDLEVGLVVDQGLVVRCRIVPTVLASKRVVVDALVVRPSALRWS